MAYSTCQALLIVIYKAYLKQHGEGCDHTIGCGQMTVNIDARDSDEAKQKLIKLVKEEYTGDYALDTCELYECSNVFAIDTDKIYSKIEQDRKNEEAERVIQQERAEFDILNKKFNS